MIEAAVNPTTRKGVSISRFEIIKTDNLLLQAWQRLSDGLAAMIVTPASVPPVFSGHEGHPRFAQPGSAENGRWMAVLSELGKLSRAIDFASYWRRSDHRRSFSVSFHRIPQDRLLGAPPFVSALLPVSPISVRRQGAYRRKQGAFRQSGKLSASLEEGGSKLSTGPAPTHCHTDPRRSLDGSKDHTVAFGQFQKFGDRCVLVDDKVQPDCSKTHRGIPGDADSPSKVEIAFHENSGIPKRDPQ